MVSIYLHKVNCLTLANVVGQQVGKGGCGVVVVVCVCVGGGGGGGWYGVCGVGVGVGLTCFYFSEIFYYC